MIFKSKEDKLKSLIRRIVVQGNHEGIVNIYREIYLSVFDEFTEENKPGMERYMKDCLEEAINSMRWETTSTVKLVKKEK